MRLQKAVMLAACLVLAHMASFPIHDLAHYCVAKALGATDITVSLSSSFNWLTQWTGGHASWFIYLSGGLFTGILYLLLAWKSRNNQSIFTSLVIIGAAQIGYGLGETSLSFEGARQWFYYLAGSGVFLGAFTVVLWHGYKLAAWLQEPSLKIRREAGN